jgi:hypothetical protein
MVEPPKRYSLSSNSSAKPATSTPAKAPAPVNTSTFLTRIANQAVREQSPAGTPQQGSPRFINSSIDHSSPAANLNSRLKWVETAFRTNEPAAQPVQQARPIQSQMPAQTASPQAADFKAAVELMRKRLQNIHVEMETLDKELSDIQQRMQ